MLWVKNLSKSFGTAKVLNNVNFKIEPGSVTGLLGPNGAGKTTTMRIIAGFLSPSQGDVFFNRLSITKDPLKIKPRIGYLAENNPLYSFLTPKEYLEFIAQLKGADKTGLAKEVGRTVDLCGIKEVINQKIETLSRGYQQRVGLAGALLNNPDLLILDEPTTALDPNQREIIKNLIKKLKKTILFSSHILSEVQDICSEVIVINKGQIVAQGKISQLTRKQVKTIKVALIINQSSERSKAKAIIEKAFGETGRTTFPPGRGKTIRFELSEFSSNAAARGQIAKLVKTNKWEIYELTESKEKLEDIFQKLTR